MALRLGALLSALLVLQSGAAPRLFIANVTVIDGSGAAPQVRGVLIRGDTIERLLPGDAAAPAGATTVDGRGTFAIPGLWDMHVHLAVRPEPELAERTLFPVFLAYGIVGVRDMGGPLERVLALRERVRTGAIEGPHVLTPGPFVDGPGDADPSFRRVTDAAGARAAVGALAAAGVDFIKVQANLSRPVWAAVLDAAEQHSLAVAGHVPIAFSATDVVRGGQRSLEHISAALVGDAGLLFACSTREAELRTELLGIERDRTTSPPDRIRERDAALRGALIDSYDPQRAAALGRAIAARGEWIVPTLIWSASVRPLGPADDGRDLPMDIVPAATRSRWEAGRAAYMEAATAADYEAAARVARRAAEAVGALHRAGAAVLAGTDTFDAFDLPGISLHQELELLVGAGLTPLEALQAATKNAAEWRGTAAHEGTIAEGKRADLVLLEASPLTDIRNTRRIRAVVQDGRVRSRADLDKLMNAARAAAR